MLQIHFHLLLVNFAKVHFSLGLKYHHYIVIIASSHRAKFICKHTERNVRNIQIGKFQKITSEKLWLVKKRNSWKQHRSRRLAGR